MSPPLWEYRTLKIDVSGFVGPKLNVDVFAEALNEQGRNGWELVSSFDLNYHEGISSDVLLIFKRPLG
jgi:hypothetical protein